MERGLCVCLLLLLCYVQQCHSASNETVVSLLQCPETSICDVASRCCEPGMDSYGWIAATVGWALWFFTLILLCIGKVMDLRPDEPKYLQA
ncbi:PREDICTED: transmembrane protein 213 [Nanorana parkeri]|uniref:transmembrane protein 213 n=1 Tax=Nanorana parkeri TaxID=125878 RepID=UPI0008545693|nr:PREDICTED: transmembrane protein 213 [Nanorana parkeri]